MQYYPEPIKSFTDKVSNLKRSNPRGWYRNVKMLLRVDNRNDVPEASST